MTPMFSGIVESSSEVLSFTQTDKFVFRLKIKKPVFFSDLKFGDSVAVNGICLTVVEFDDKTVQFDVAFETLKVTGWDKSPLKPGQRLNLERSLKFGDRVHGHFLSGHVDNLGEVVYSQALDASTWMMRIKLNDSMAKYFVWPKGSIGLSGVSLTVNAFEDQTVEVCLIPETLNVTCLKDFQVGDFINIEYDWMAKAIYQQTKQFQQTQNLKQRNL